MKNNKHRFVIGLALVLLFPSNARADENFINWIMANNKQSRSGQSVATDGPYEIAGAHGSNAAAFRGGMAIAREAGWADFQGLLDPDASEWDLCGYSVAIADPYWFVGCIGADVSRGKVVVFERICKIQHGRDCFVHFDTVYAQTRNRGDNFGFSIAAEGEYVLIGAPDSDGSETTDSGEARLFWISAPEGRLIPVNTITPPNPSNGDRFGLSVAIDTTSGSPRAAISAPLDDDQNNDAGAVYTYTQLLTGQPGEKLLPPNGNKEICGMEQGLLSIKSG